MYTYVLYQTSKKEQFEEVPSWYKVEVETAGIPRNLCKKKVHICIMTFLNRPPPHLNPKHACDHLQNEGVDVPLNDVVVDEEDSVGVHGVQ